MNNSTSGSEGKDEMGKDKYRIAYKVRRYTSEDWIYCIKSTWDLYPDENRTIEYIPLSLTNKQEPK
jgi:hypothetical protein